MTDKKSVSLASLMTPSKTVTLDFPGYAGLKIDLCYLARDALLKLRKKCVSTKFDRKTRQPEEMDSKPPIHFKRVLLPHPLLPSKAILSPIFTEKVISSNTDTDLASITYSFDTRSAINFMIQPMKRVLP